MEEGRFRSLGGSTDILKNRVSQDVISATEIRFPDFELPFSFGTVLEDYPNLLAPITFLSLGNDDFVLKTLRTMNGLGFPSMVDYFCIKSISGGVTMDEKAIAKWDAMEESGRETYRKALVFSYLGDLTANQSRIIDMAEENVERVALIVSAIVELVDKNEISMEDIRLSIGGLQHLQVRVADLMRMMENPAAMRREIEGIQ